MEYGYVRVSSVDQNVDRQINEMNALNIKSHCIFIDYQSGKNFNRKAYQMMRSKLKRNDTLFIKSIDRLGRNYEMIIEEWKFITKKIEANIVVIDMPLLDTRQENKKLVGRFIADIVLQILSFVAQTERDSIKKRQAEGIRLAKARGVHMGRPKKSIPQDFPQIIFSLQNDFLSLADACKQAGMCRSTFKKYMKEFLVHDGKNQPCD